MKFEAREQDLTTSPEKDGSATKSTGNENLKAKRALRKQILATRRSKYTGQFALESTKALNEVLQRELMPLLEQILATKVALGFEPHLTIAGFMPTPAEASAMPFLRQLALTGHTVLFPTFAGDLLNWRSWDGESDFIPSQEAKFGAEPVGEIFGSKALANADLVLAPAVAVDYSGSRLGHGKGYYDRALQHLKAGAKVFSVVHETELLPANTVPVQAHDFPIDGVVTELGITIFAVDGS